MMLLQLLINHPQAIGAVLKNTPVWVWGLLAGLLALGFSQARRRTASLARITLMPVAMTGFAIWGMYSAFGATSLLATVLVAWLAAASPIAAIVMRQAPGGTYDAQSRQFHLAGSWIPLLLILGVFLTKYIVGVELTMQPQLTRDTTFALTLAVLYGAFNGIFTGRALRLLRLVPSPINRFA